MIAEIKEKLRTGVVTFTFKKNDGSERQAKGTLMTDVEVVGETFVAPTGRGAIKEGVTAYWDLEKDGWRCFNDDSLVSIDDFKQLKQDI